MSVQTAEGPTLSDWEMSKRKAATIPSRRTARGASHLTDEQYAALPTVPVGDEGRRGWSWQCDCGRWHLADDPLGAGDVLSCPRSKRQYRCL